MHSNSWLAIDVGTSPMVRAQELRFAWERFVEGEDDENPELVRDAIADSWRRSSAAGVAPTGNRFAPVVAGEEETHDLWEDHPLGRAYPLIRSCLSATAEEGGYLIVISDADGVLLCIEGSAAIRMRAAEVMNFAEGTLWSETGAGTNAIGTAVAVDHAVQVFGPEHFHEPVQRWVCSAAPIHDPDTGALIGVIDLTGDFSTVHPASLAVATATAAAVEGSLLLDLQERDARLRARYGDAVDARARHQRAGGAVRTADHAAAGHLGRDRPPGHPARRRRADPAQRRARGRRAGRPLAQRLRRPGRRPAAERTRRGRCSSSRCSATARPCWRSTAGARSCARGSPRSSCCCAPTRTA